MRRPRCYAHRRNTLRRKPASLRALRRYGHFFTSRARACVRVCNPGNVHFSPVRGNGRNGRNARNDAPCRRNTHRAGA